MFSLVLATAFGRLESEDLQTSACMRLKAADYIGGDFEIFRASESSCCNACAANPNCHVATLYQGNCQLKDFRAQPNGFGPGVSFLSYRPPPPTAKPVAPPTADPTWVPRPVEPKCVYESGMDYCCDGLPGCELASLANSDQFSCCDMCDANPHCAHAVLMPGYKNSCYLKGVHARPCARAGRFSFSPGDRVALELPQEELLKAESSSFVDLVDPLPHLGAMCTYQTDVDYACDGDASCELRTIPNSNQIECCEACQADWKCHHAVFYQNYQNSCYLKARSARAVRTVGRWSFSPLFRTGGGGEELALAPLVEEEEDDEEEMVGSITCQKWLNIDYLGGDIEIFRASQTACCNACSANPNCHVAVLYQGNCQLKDFTATSETSFAAYGRIAFISYRPPPPTAKPVAPPSPPPAPKKCLYESHMDYACDGLPGCELASIPNSDQFTCCDMCAANPHCAHAVLLPSTQNTCYLKGINALPRPRAGRYAFSPTGRQAVAVEEIEPQDW